MGTRRLALFFFPPASLDLFMPSSCLSLLSEIKEGENGHPPAIQNCPRIARTCASHADAYEDSRRWEPFAQVQRKKSRCGGKSPCLFAMGMQTIEKANRSPRLDQKSHALQKDQQKRELASRGSSALRVLSFSGNIKGALPRPQQPLWQNAQTGDSCSPHRINAGEAP